MDVTCERCGTEYEFDETLLSGRGTSVKCTNCGHVFKVYPKAQNDVDRSTSTWRLVRRDGSIDTIDSLRELQRRIAAGELMPSDQIARGNESFKALGSIPELETFFHAAEGEARTGVSAPVTPPASESTSQSSSPPGRRPRQPTLLGVVPVPKPIPSGTGPSTTTPPTGVAGNENATAPIDVEQPTTRREGAEESARLPETRDQGVTAPVDASASAKLPETDDEPVMAATSATESFSLPEERESDLPADIEDAEFEEGVSAGRRSTQPPAYYDDDEDIPELPGRGWSPTRWLLAVAIIGALALVGSQWTRIVEMLGFSEGPEAAAAIQEGDLALAADHLDAYERAIAAYERARQAGDDGDATLLIQLARANALAAQAIRDQARGESTRSTSAAYAKAALNYAEQALMIDAQSLDARLAEADGLRLSGDIERARESLERGRLMPSSRTPEFFRIDALLKGAEHGNELDKGLLSAKQASELAPNGIRYQLLLARAELASDSADRARVHVDAVLAMDPDHPAATALLAELKAAGEVSVVDAGVGVDAAMADAGTAAAAATVADADAGTTEEAVSDAGTTEEAMADAGVATEAETEPGDVRAAGRTEQSPPARKARGSAAKRSRSRSAERPEYDEYDRLAQAAGSDAFVDGRPPLRDFGWYMREGEAALAGGDYTKARALFESALESRPGSGDATDALGRVAFASGDYELALRYFRSAAQRGHPDGYYNLGRAYERMGRNDEAISSYYTYLKRRPSGTHVAAARSAIKNLDPRVKLPGDEDATKPQSTVEPEPEADAESKAPSRPTQETPSP